MGSFAKMLDHCVSGLRAAADTLIYRASVYGVPLAVGVVTVIALSAWDETYPEGSAAPLKLSVLRDPEHALIPAQALLRLRDVAAVQHHDTRLAEHAFWFSFVAQPFQERGAVQIELPSRHATEVECWDGGTLDSLGRADRGAASGHTKPVKAGFAIGLGPIETATTVLCRGRFAGPARISALQWTETGLGASAEKFHRNAGLLEGGVLVLAAFVLVTAVVNREWLYVLFAAWLLASLRLGAISAGWDTQWLGRTIPPEWILLARKLTIATYYMLTYALFRRLFTEELERVGHGVLLALAQALCVVLIGAAVVLPRPASGSACWRSTWCASCS
jgi:hypothetical protein